ncbi:cation channel family protein (macronuclear) [Tetrahymena thermophila SB210]|uniref:Cation channel family protein n=1 Tax=Tetrahymena thermophila (strain SB210) TaxID=312017 RepID=Q22LQ6_TETTS|nr:cation channel family protein [Tetrahymena thermophila SB210]EAR86210.2 cation channel family protein [Tetrahymena thermophila SB210]|eukprot:XP_976805.2 cation channel family protein [Tetrahymena thermophila SB210]
MYNEMVEIFYSRQHEKTLTEDEYGTKNISINRIQSSLQELSTKKIQLDAEINPKMQKSIQIIDSKKQIQSQNEENQLSYIQNNNEISYLQFKNGNYDTDIPKQNQKCQLQDSLSMSMQNDNKKLVYFDCYDLKNSLQHIQNINNSTSNLNTLLGSPSFKNKPQSHESNTPQGANEMQQDQKKVISKYFTSNIDSKEVERVQSNQQSDNKIEYQQDVQSKKQTGSFRIALQNNNNNQNGGGAIESPNKKQKQILSSVHHLSRKKDSRKITENEKQLLQKKQKRNNFIHIIMKMKNYAYKMASNIESKRLALLQRQKFYYLRDKTINYDKQEKENYEFYDYNYFQKIIHLFFKQANSIKLIKTIRKNTPTIPLFHPQSIMKFIWDILNMIIVIVFFFYLPLYFIYGIPFSSAFYLENLDIFLATIATLDVFVKLNTVQYKKGNLLHSRTLILLEQISKDGLLNISFVIIVWINVAQQRNQLELVKDNKISVLFFMVALFKVFKQTTFKNRIYDRFYLRKMNRGFISLLQIFFNLFIVSHLFACIWLVFGKMDQTEDSIFCAQQGSSYYNINNCSYTWLDKLQGIKNLNFYEQYLRAYYFTTVTMITVGYGDIIPVNSREYLLSVLTMLIACGMFGYSLNSIGQILSEMNINNKEYDEHFNAIYGFMHKKNVSIDLQVQVREYLQYFFIQSNQEDIQKQQKVIALLPESLQNQMMLEANKIVFEKSPLFRKNFSQQIIQKTIKLIEQKEFKPGQKIIMQEVENDYCIYFIEKGSVEIYNSNNNEKLKVLHKGDYFGEIQFFTGKSSQLSVRSVEFTKLLSIKRSNFYELIQSSPIDLEKFCMIKDSITFNNKLDLVGVVCYCCKSTTHLVTECNFIHLCSDKFKIIKEYAKNDFQTRDKDIQRKSFSYNSLQVKHQVEEGAKQFIDENLEDLSWQGWFNDAMKQEFQEDLNLIKNGRGQPSLRTIGNQQNLNNIQKIKSQQNIQNQLQNIKLQYQFIKNTNVNNQDNTNMNMNSELNYIDRQDRQSIQIQQKSYNTLDKQSLQVQQKSNNNFQYTVNNDDYSQSSNNGCTQCKKVYFSIKSLQDKIVDDDQGDNKSQLTQQCQHSQFVTQQNQPSNIYNNFIQGDGGNILNTPTNRQRQLSNMSEMCPSPYSANNKLYVNVNTPNYFNTNNLNPQTSLGFQFYNPQNSNYSIPEFVNPNSSQESNHLTNNDNYSQFSNKIKLEDNKLYNKQIYQQKSFNQNDQKEQYANKSSLKTDILSMKKSQNRYLSKQLSSYFQKQANEALLKQLKELFQQPQKQNTQDCDFQFETLKSYQFYMPQNNYERVLLLYSVQMRKHQTFQYKTIKSLSNKNNDNKPNEPNQKSQPPHQNEAPKNIQYYQDLIKENQLQNQSKQQLEEDSKSNKSK